MLDLFLGDPIYDDQQRVIRRDFGVKNMIIIGVCGWVVLGLMEGNGNNLKSGKGMMKGGGPRVLWDGVVNEITTFFTGDAWWQPGKQKPKSGKGGWVVFLVLIALIGGGIYLGMAPSAEKERKWARRAEKDVAHAL